MIRKYAEIFCWKNVSSFCSAKATHIFSAKNIRILCIESARTVNEMTLNELVKLTTLWTTGPRINVSTYPYLSKIFTISFIMVISWFSQLCHLLNACCMSDKSLYLSKWAMIFEHTIRMYKQLTWLACQGHGAIITSNSPIPLLRVQIFARSPFLGRGVKFPQNLLVLKV